MLRLAPTTISLTAADLQDLEQRRLQKNMLKRSKLAQTFGAKETWKEYGCSFDNSSDERIVTPEDESSIGGEVHRQLDHSIEIMDDLENELHDDYDNAVVASAVAALNLADPPEVTAGEIPFTEDVPIALHGASHERRSIGPNGPELPPPFSMTPRTRSYSGGIQPRQSRPVGSRSGRSHSNVQFPGSTDPRVGMNDPDASFEIYDDERPQSLQPRTPRNLPEARHQSRLVGSQTAPPGRRPQGAIESQGIGYRRRDGSPVGLRTPGFRGLYGGLENTDEEWTAYPRVPNE